MSVKVTEGLPTKGPRGGAGVVVNIDGKTKVHRGYKRVDIDGKDAKHAKEILREHFPETGDKAAENVELQEREQRQGEVVRYPNGPRLRLSGEHAEHAIRHMRRVVKGGPPATRPTFTMGAHIENGVVVRDE